jgi:hypothetical protein
MKTKFFSTFFLCVTLLTSCSFGASAEPTLTPVNLNAVKTSAVQTVVAPITQTAAAFTPSPANTETPVIPTGTPTPSETPTPSGGPKETPCDNLEFINDSSIPDGTTMTADQQFVKTWKVKNTGACIWTTGYTIALAYGESLNGQTTALTSEVLPNTDTEVSVTLTAPSKPGTYIGYWRLKNNNGYFFGTQLTVNIVVP